MLYFEIDDDVTWRSDASSEGLKGVDVPAGSRVYLRFAATGREFHERFVTGVTRSGIPVMMTSDEDHYLHRHDMLTELHLDVPRDGVLVHLPRLHY